MHCLLNVTDDSSTGKLNGSYPRTKNTPFFSVFYNLQSYTFLTSDFRVWKRCMRSEV